MFQWASKNYSQLCHDHYFTLFGQLELGSQYGWDCGFNFMEVLELGVVSIPQKKTLSVNFYPLQKKRREKGPSNQRLGPNFKFQRQIMDTSHWIMVCWIGWKYAWFSTSSFLCTYPTRYKPMNDGQLICVTKNLSYNIEESKNWSEMILKYLMIVERYPKSNVLVDDFVPGCENLLSTWPKK